jgi:hypothetical protein
MSHENSTVEVVVCLESPPLKISVTRRCLLGEINQTISSILDELSKSERKLPSWAKAMAAPPVEKAAPAAKMTPREDPLERIALRLDVPGDKLRTANLFGVKGDKVQILKTQKFTASEAVMAICLVSETGLGRPALSYEDLKEAFQESSIKSKSPLYMIISNLGNLGYIDKKRYDSQAEVVLTAKGEAKVGQAISKALG